MAITDETITGLRTAAVAGDAGAALQLGRLLCLTAADPQGSGDLTWPEERWLRAAVAARPDDVEALLTLAGRLAQRIWYWKSVLETNPGAMAEHGQSEDTIRQLQTEAEELYARIRAAGPSGHAEPGLDALAVVLGLSDKPPAEDVYSFHVLEDEDGSGPMVYRVTVVASGTDEIRWACDAWLAQSDGGFSGAPMLTTYVAGAEAGSIDLGRYIVDGAVSWDAVAVPELTGPRLPPGLPVPGLGLYYGFSAGAE